MNLLGIKGEVLNILSTLTIYNVADKSETYSNVSKNVETAGKSSLDINIVTFYQQYVT